MARLGRERRSTRVTTGASQYGGGVNGWLIAGCVVTLVIVLMAAAYEAGRWTR